MPVAHPDEDGKGSSGRGAVGEALGLSGGQLREGRAAAHDVVVVRHFLDASGATRRPRVLEKRTNVRLSCGPPKAIINTASKGLDTSRLRLY